MTDGDIKTDQETLQADENDARVAHRADRMPTPDEEREAEKHELDPAAAKAYEEAMERGANAKGEGRIP